MHTYFWLIVAAIAILVIRIGRRALFKSSKRSSFWQPKNMSDWQRKVYTIWVFFLINLKRVFRDRTALFFTFLFPLIFLFVLGGIFGKNQSVSFHVAIINHSNSQYAKQFIDQAESPNQKVLKVDNTVTNINQANDKMGRGELDATIELPANFGLKVTNSPYPTGQAIIHYTQNNEQAAQTLASVLQAQFQAINSRFVKTETPFTVASSQTNTRSLSQFDYTFTGLVGFAILGTGIFGPINVFPELKKMGILRRLHTTPIRVWQYFTSTMLGYATVGLMSLAVMFIFAISVFHLKVVGNYFELAVYLAFSIVMILGLGLAVGGWARNERQAAPLANIIVFPMMFLSGTFFPRFLMPQWLQNFSGYLPLTPVIDGARLIATEGKNLIDLGPQLGIMAVWTVVVYIVAFRVFRWE